CDSLEVGLSRSVAEPVCVVQCCPLATQRITSYAEVAERQTHQLEGLAGATPWRFESSLPHHSTRPRLSSRPRSWRAEFPLPPASNGGLSEPRKSKAVLRRVAARRGLAQNIPSASTSRVECALSEPRESTDRVTPPRQTDLHAIPVGHPRVL